MKKTFTLCCCLFSLSAFAKKSPVGNWLGTIDAGPARVRAVFHISDSGGVIRTIMDSPDQGVKGIRVSVSRFEHDSLTLFLGSASYKGRMLDDNTIEGVWTQGQAFPLIIHREELKEKPQTPVPPFPYLSEDVTFTNKESNMTYGATITAPRDNKKHPALLLITGSGQQNRDEEILGHKPFMVIADYLTRRGYVVLRVDDRGKGKTSAGNIMTVTTADFAKDASAELDYLKARPEVDTGKIGLLGHSEGGMIATMLAAQRKDIAFIISFAGPGVSNLELMLAQNDAILKQQDLGEDARKAYLRLYRAMLIAAMNAEGGAALTASLTKVVTDWRQTTPQKIVAETTDISDSTTQRRFVSTFAMQLGLPWFRYFIAYDPSTIADKISSKVLVLNGEKDIQVVASLNLEGWRALLRKGNARSYEVKELAGLNHLFQECVRCDVDEYGTLEQTISPTALNAIGNWLDKEVK
jgi:hypothetical protein